MSILPCTYHNILEFIEYSVLLSAIKTLFLIILNIITALLTLVKFSYYK